MARPWGRTPGMRRLGLKVETTQGGRPSCWAALKRAGASYLSFSLYVGYPWAVWDPRRQTWHDKIAGTFVVSDRQLICQTSSARGRAAMTVASDARASDLFGETADLGRESGTKAGRQC